MTRTRTILALGLGAILACVAPVGAQRSLAIESFAAEVSVDRDGHIEVAETIRARFTGSWNGLYRTIPVEYVTPQGLNYSLRLRIDAVTDESGRALRYESSRERHYRKLKVWVPGAQDTVRTIVIRYHVANALRFFHEAQGRVSEPGLLKQLTDAAVDFLTGVANAFSVLRCSRQDVRRLEETDRRRRSLPAQPAMW